MGFCCSVHRAARERVALKERFASPVPLQIRSTQTVPRETLTRQTENLDLNTALTLREMISDILGKKKKRHFCYNATPTPTHQGREH